MVSVLESFCYCPGRRQFTLSALWDLKLSDSFKVGESLWKDMLEGDSIELLKMKQPLPISRDWLPEIYFGVRVCFLGDEAIKPKTGSNIKDCPRILRKSLESSNRILFVASKVFPRITFENLSLVKVIKKDGNIKVHIDANLAQKRRFPIFKFFSNKLWANGINLAPKGLRQQIPAGEFQLLPPC